MPSLLDRLLDKVYIACRDRRTDIETQRGIVSFTFDDFPATALHNGAPILEDSGWRGTYYTCGGMLGGLSESGVIASARDVEVCLERGHEIANHTLNHCNCVEADAATIRREITENLAALPEGATNNFAFPFGAANIRECRIASDIVTTARGVQHGINGRGAQIKDLRANPIYSANGLETLYSLIRETAASRGWLILYTHDVADKPSQFGCTPQDFAAIVAAVRETELDVLTVEQARRTILHQSGGAPVEPMRPEKAA